MLQESNFLVLEFVEADAIAEWINDVHCTGSVKFILDSRAQVFVTLARYLAVEFIDSGHLDVNVNPRRTVAVMFA